MKKKRAFFKQCACQIAAECEQKPYEHWMAADFPITFDRDFDGQMLQVEIIQLEAHPEYVHLLVSVDDGGLSAFAPPSTSTIIRKSAPTD